MKRRTIRRMFALMLTLLMVMGTLAGCGENPANPSSSTGNAGSGAANGEGVITLKLAHVCAASSHYEAGAQEFARLVNEKSNGRIVIETYPGGVLGSERETIEALQMGSLDMCLVSVSPLTGFLPEMALFDLPFLFRDREHAYAVADGEVGTELLNRLDSQKIVGLAYWETGFRHVFGNFEVNSPADIVGKKIRVMESAIHMSTFETLGAIPTPMAYGELFTALQQKTVDGAENSILAIATDKFNEATTHMALTGHFYGAVPLLVSKSIFETLSAEDQQIIKECAKEAGDFQRKYTADNEETALESLRESGMIITEPDRDAFREICEPIYSDFYDVIPQEMIEAAINS